MRGGTVDRVRDRPGGQRDPRDRRAARRPGAGRAGMDDAAGGDPRDGGQGRDDGSVAPAPAEHRLDVIA